MCKVVCHSELNVKHFNYNFSYNLILKPNFGIFNVNKINKVEINVVILSIKLIMK